MAEKQFLTKKGYDERVARLEELRLSEERKLPRS